MTVYNHMFSVAFSVETTSSHENGISGVLFTNALLQRIIDLNKHCEWHEAVGPPLDTYEVQDDND